MKETISECTLCTTENKIKKIPSTFNSRIKRHRKGKKVGEVVEAFIEEAREEVREEKKKMTRIYES